MANQSKLSKRIVYVLKNQDYRDGLRKVGISNKMLGDKGRLTTLRTPGVPGHFEIVCAIVCEEVGKAAIIEDSLHSMWKEKNINKSPTGSQEWFHGISDAEYKAQFELLIKISGGKIQWWTKENDCPSGDEPDEEELSLPFDEVASIVSESSAFNDIRFFFSSSPPAPPAPPAPVVSNYLSKYDHNATTVDTYPLLKKAEKLAYQTWRCHHQGFRSKAWRKAIKQLKREQIKKWDDIRLSYVLLRNDYEWLTPELRRTLKDCF